MKTIQFKIKWSLLKRFNLYFLVTLSCLIIPITNSYSQLVVDTTQNSNVYKNLFFETDSNIVVENFSISGNIFSIAYFQNYCIDLMIENGIILSTGNAVDIIGPNDKSNSGSRLYFNGDKDLDLISKGKTFDAISIEFDFIPNSDSISFEYIFASEEYPEYVNKGLNDAFAIFISKAHSSDKINLATITNSSLPITVNNINDISNSKFFISNNDKSNCLYYSLQFDGLSTLLAKGYKVEPYQNYHLKFCISDVGDGYFDSAVLLNAHSFKSSGKYDFKYLSDTLSLQDDLVDEIIEVNSNQILFSANIKFDYNSFNINNNSYSNLDKIALILKNHFDFQIEIGGYTDNTGSLEFNKELSCKRANEVASYLILKGIDINRIKTEAYGSTNPIADNSTYDGRAKNRRVIFRFYKN